MINKLKILGEYVHENEDDSNPLNLNLALESANVVILDYSIEDQKCDFVGLDTIEYDATKREYFLLLKDIKGNKVSPFPTVYIDKQSVNKSLKKLARILNDSKKINPKITQLAALFDNEYKSWISSESKNNSIDEQTKLINTEPSNYFNQITDYISDDDKNLCTIRINNRFVGESSFFQSIKEKYTRTFDNEYYKKYSTTSLGENNKCYTCGNSKDILYGFCDTFKFYSANETAYIAGGFQKEKTWKNYPVCPECAKYLRLGREKLNRNLNRYFYGNKYFLIPAPTLDKGVFYTTLKNIEEDFRDLSLNKEQESNQQLRNEMEEDVFETLAKQENQATFTFFFYAANNSEFKILQEAEDILPSRFQIIINAKKKVEDFTEFKSLKGLYKKGESHNLAFNFGIVRAFFPSNFNNDFLDIVTKILKGQKISKSFILHQVSEHLAKGFRSEKLYHDIKKAMIFLKFLYELNLIGQTKHKMEIKMGNKYEDYFQLHPEFYDADWKKTVFLTGVLAQHVMDIQYRERKATPFRSRLNGLKLDNRAIKRLLPESIEKLEQYKSNYYRELEEVIARLMESGEPDLKQQSVDEISFFFAMGMNLNKQFKSKKETEGENNE